MTTPSYVVESEMARAPRSTWLYVYNWGAAAEVPALAVHVTARTGAIAAELADAAVSEFKAREGVKVEVEAERHMALRLAPGSLWPEVDECAVCIYADDRAPHSISIAGLVAGRPCTTNRPTHTRRRTK